jgi:hypothetical protein
MLLDACSRLETDNSIFLHELNKIRVLKTCHGHCKECVYYVCAILSPIVYSITIRNYISLLQYAKPEAASAVLGS